MGILTLNPISIYNFGRGSWGANSGTLGPSTVNSANAVYARLNSNYGSATNGASLKFRVGSAQLPGGAKVEYMRPGFSIRTSNITQESHFRAMIQNVRGGNGLGSNAVTWSGQLKLTQSASTFYTVYGVSEKTTKSNGVVYGDSSITQTDINNLVVEVFDVGSTVVQIDRMWIEVSYDLKPTVEINSPGTVSETTSPTITFDYDDDKMPLDAIDVELYSGSTLLHTEDKLSVDSPSYSIPLSLEDGTYTIKMRAYQQWNYAGSAPVSDWDTDTFTIQIGKPAVPEFTATAEPTLGRVKLVAKTNLNLLSVDAAEGAPAAWNNVFNGKVYTGDVFQPTNGDRSLLITINPNGTSTNAYLAGELIPVVAGKYYAFGFNARPHPVDAPKNLQAGIQWINAAGGVVSNTLGNSTLEIAGQWKPIVHSQIAPVGAVFAKPFIVVLDQVLDAWHYIDGLQFVTVASLVDLLPAWSRGGFSNTNSRNLLSYGDSTLESISHWTPVAAEANSKEATVSVVNVVAETGDIEDSYQGDNMLKLATVDTLIKRDVEPAFSTGTALNVSKGETQDGDYMVAYVQVQTPTTTVTPPAGWSTLSQSTGTSQRVYSFGKFASAEPTTITFTASAAGKHAIGFYAWSGIDPTTPVHFINAPAPTPNLAANATITFATGGVPHNAPVMNALLGRRVASTTQTAFTSNLGGNNDMLLSTTNNTAAEVASGFFSRKYNTGTTTDLSLSGRTMSAAHALTDVIPIVMVLRPDRSTVRATLRDYEYYEYNDTKDYVLHTAVMGASHTNATSANRQVSVLLDLYTDDKVFVAGYYIGSIFATPGEWKKISTVNTLIPSHPTARWATLRLEVDQMTDFEAYYFDAISLYESDTNVGYIEGYKAIDGPYLEVEYSEDDGETWKTADDTNAIWMVQKLTDFHDATIEFYDYEIASGVDRLYRMFNWKIEEGNILESDYSTTKEAGIVLSRVWMHLVDDPAGTIKMFEYDGGNRSESFDKLPVIQQYAGREFGQAYFGSASSQDIQGSFQLTDADEIAALRGLNKATSEIIYRDGRGIRVKGLLLAEINYEPYGATISYTVKTIGLQP